MKKIIHRLIWNSSQDKKNLDFYLGFLNKGIPLPKEWQKHCNELAKKEQSVSP